MTLLLPAAALAAGLVLLASEPTRVSALPEARDLAMRRLAHAPRGAAVVFDFDDTLFAPDSVVGTAHVGAREFWYGDRKAVPLYRPIQEMCDVLKFAVARGLYVVVITARPDTHASKMTVLHNFRKQRMQIHELHCNPHYPRHMGFKARLRRVLQTKRPIALTVGDQWGDVSESDGYDWIKLPSAREPLMLSSLK